METKCLWYNRIMILKGLANLRTIFIGYLAFNQNKLTYAEEENCPLGNLMYETEGNVCAFLHFNYFLLHMNLFIGPVNGLQKQHYNFMLM